MLTQIAFFEILGLPLNLYLGILTLILLLIAGAVGSLQMKGKLKISVKAHIRLAWVVTFFAVIHAILGISSYL